MFIPSILVVVVVMVDDIGEFVVIDDIHDDDVALRSSYSNPDFLMWFRIGWPLSNPVFD